MDIKEKVLIVGGAGYIGSVLSRKLLNEGFKVRVLDYLRFGQESVLDLMTNPNFELIYGDYRHLDNVTKAIENVDHVIHLAGIVGDPACSINKTFTLENNFFATVALANICKYYKVKRFIFSSSCSVYGFSEDILDETSKLSPMSLYAEDKILSEQGILSLMDENFTPTILRLSTLFGWSPRMRFDLVVNILTGFAKTKGQFSVFGGDQWRPFVHIQDVVEAFAVMIREPIENVRGQIFNVGSNANNYKIIEVAEMVKIYFPSSLMEVDTNDIDKRNYHIKFDKIEHFTSFKAKHDILFGIDEIAKEMDKTSLVDINSNKYSNFKKTQEKLELDSCRLLGILAYSLPTQTTHID